MTAGRVRQAWRRVAPLTPLVFVAPVLLVLILAATPLGPLSLASLDRASPLQSAGPGTRTVAVALSWAARPDSNELPAWMSDRDRANLDRLNAAILAADFTGIATYVSALDRELAEKGHSVNALRGELIGQMATLVLTEHFSPLIFGLMLSLLFALVPLLTPLFWLWRLLFGIVGVVLLWVLLFLLASTFGFVIRGQPGLFYGLTEYVYWLSLGLILSGVLRIGLDWRDRRQAVALETGPTGSQPDP